METENLNKNYDINNRTAEKFFIELEKSFRQWQSNIKYKNNIN
jgi:Holliday junction resolvasome RuvABC DNA-binding subunit